MRGQGAISAKQRFIVQQGLAEPPARSAVERYSALQFQPRVVGAGLLLGVILQSALAFLLISLLLAWSASRPRANPFDRIYNARVRPRTGWPLPPARAPRRFAQAMEATCSLAIALALAGRQTALARVLELALLVVAAGIVLRGFCFGAYSYQRLRTWRAERH